tara:strand:- start:82 stop:582 length:501 start_codon:yes stop_codon:yes gene_type:complete
MNNILTLLLLTSLVSFSQTNKKYNLYVKMDSNINGARVQTLKNDTLAIKIFYLNKPKAYDSPPKQTLKIDDKGNVERIIIADLGNRMSCCSIQLYYYSTQNKKFKVKRTETLNMLTYEDLMKSKFENFLELLLKAEHVYVIDSSDIGENDEDYFMAYEVRVDSIND